MTEETKYKIRRYRIENAVCTESKDWVNLTSVIDVRPMFDSELEIGTYAIAHFKRMLEDELKRLEKGTKKRIISEVIKTIKSDEKLIRYSGLNIHLKLGVMKNCDTIREVTREEYSKYAVNPFENEVENSIEYEIS